MTPAEILEHVETTDVDVFDDAPDVPEPAILEHCRAVVAAENAKNEAARDAAELDAIADYAARQDATSAAIEDALTPAEQEAKERWEAAEMRRLKSESAQFGRDLKEDLAARGIDIVDYCHENDIPLHSRQAEQIAKSCGYHQTTWNDGRNVARREKESAKRVARAGKARRLAAAVANKPQTVKAAPKAAAVDDDGDLPAIPTTTDRDELAAWAREYCHALCEIFPSAKLVKKLFGGPDNPGGSCNWQISVMPPQDEKLPTWAQSARLSFDKKVGA